MAITLKDLGKVVKETTEKIINDGGIKVHEKPDVVVRVEPVDMDKDKKIDGGKVVVIIKYEF